MQISLVTARAWNEGGTVVPFEANGDDFAVGVRTWGQHPNVFVFDPRPLWRRLAEGWDVIDIHEEPCSLATAEILLLRALRAVRTPFVLYSAQNIDKRYPPPFRWIERWAVRHVAAVSVCNRAAGQILRRKGLRGRVVEIPLGVDVGCHTPAARNAPGEELRIGYVGRLEAHKGIDVLLESVAPRPTWTLAIVGGGPAESDLRRRAKVLGLAERVTFVGPVDHGALPATYRSFDVVAIPSVPTPRWEEQFCRVAVEAMASGVPVVASRSGALPEVIGDAGILAAPGDAGELRGALDQVATDPGVWEKLRRAGLERAARFSWESVADDYVRLYRAETTA